MYELKMMMGVKELKPIEYRIVIKWKNRLWWQVMQYYVESEFCILGPYETYDEAHDIAMMASGKFVKYEPV